MDEREMDANRNAEELSFRLLYFTYIDKILQKNKLSVGELENRVERLKAAFRFGEGGRGLKEFNLDLGLNACAYLNRFGPLSSGLVRQRILEALADCQELRSKIRFPELHILDLGSGPGTDVVGFCSAVWEMVQRETAAPQCERLDFTLVDCIENWKHTSRVLEHLIRENNYGFVSRVFQRKKVGMEFLLVNLNSDLEREVILLKKIMDADIILVPRLLLHLANSEEFLDTIHKHMNPDSIVVFIEPRSCMTGILKEQKNFELIYEHPKEVSGKEPPENFRLRPWEEDEPFPEYRSNICLESNNRIFVFKRTERKENSSVAEEISESSK